MNIEELKALLQTKLPTIRDEDLRALLAIAEAAQAVDASAPLSLYTDETDDPRCVDPYIVGRIPFRKLREALKGLA